MPLNSKNLKDAIINAIDGVDFREEPDTRQAAIDNLPDTRDKAIEVLAEAIIKHLKNNMQIIAISPPGMAGGPLIPTGGKYIN